MLNYPPVALDFMNRDHAEFVTLRDKLLGLSPAQAHADEMDTLLDELLEHTRHHFAEEERLMLETRFPPYRMHKHEHDRVLQEMEASIAQWRKERNIALLHKWLEDTVGDWFVTHVSTMDSVTAGFIKAQGKG